MKNWNIRLQQSVTDAMENLIEKVKNFTKARDPLHYQEKYWGAAHLSCNLKFKEHSYIPIIAHYPSGYDNCLILARATESSKSVIFFYWEKV